GGGGLSTQGGDARVDELQIIRYGTTIDLDRLCDGCSIPRPRHLDVRKRGGQGNGRQEHVPLPEEGAIRCPVLLTLPIPREVVAEARQQSAALRLGELVVLGTPELGQPLPLGLRVARPRDGGQQVMVEAMMRAQVTEALWLGYFDVRPGMPETCHDLLLCCEDLRVNGDPVDWRQYSDAKVAQVLMTRRRYGEAPGGFLAAIGTGEDIQRQCKVLGTARQRPLHAHDGWRVRDGRERELPATR